MPQQTVIRILVLYRTEELNTAWEKIADTAVKFQDANKDKLLTEEGERVYLMWEGSSERSHNQLGETSLFSVERKYKTKT